MRQSLRLGRIAGIPVGVHWSVLIIAILLIQLLAVNVLPRISTGYSAAGYWLVAVLIAVAFLASLLVHEFSHALVARHYGMRVRRITLWLLGGVSELEDEPPHPRADLFIALAGPLASLAAAIVFAAAASTSLIGLPRLATGGLVWLAVVNLTLAVFNLLPGAPLDGGRVLRAILWWARHDRDAAARGAARAGVVLGILVAGAGAAEILFTANFGGLWLILLGWFLIVAANAEFTQTQTHSALADIRVGDVMNGRPVSGDAIQTIDDFIASVARHYPYRSFPVTGYQGEVLGVVDLARLGQVPAAQRHSVRLGDVALKPPAVLGPAQPLSDAASGVKGRGEWMAPVTANGHLVGVLTTGDVTRAMELATLGSAPGQPPTQAG